LVFVATHGDASAAPAGS